MEIKNFTGRQLEKSVPASPEDGFIRSQVIYHEDRFEQEFQLVYPEYFNRNFSTVTPFDKEPVISSGPYHYDFKEVAALALLITNPEYKQQKRLYVPDWDHFSSLFEKVEWDTVEKVINEMLEYPP
ncbi:hypothetical protein GWK91_06550 [Virgibacillus sp. MSP4-1]|uniref:hypothetical protein n=1 Tax=Virgibacillus sp. MSP4-1 TaxID=2700081 RepID=UPI00039BB862|nr:hypothetical protein [Virgibacillus sp. MSP4-1]QHS22627.1 hypothetical protein GWK91_06550 [Virgibacillus sp. MSP4-1]